MRNWREYGELRKDMNTLLLSTASHVPSSIPESSNQRKRKPSRGGPRPRYFDRSDNEPLAKIPRYAELDIPGPNEPASLKGDTVNRRTTLYVLVESVQICNDWKRKQRSGLQELAFEGLEIHKRVPMTVSHKDNWIDDAFQHTEDKVISVGMVNWSSTHQNFITNRKSEVSAKFYNT